MSEEEADPWELLISAIKARDAEIERLKDTISRGHTDGGNE